MPNIAPIGFSMDADMSATIQIGIPVSLETGDPFPFSDYTFRFLVSQPGCNFYKAVDGVVITVDVDASKVNIVVPAGQLCCGVNSAKLVFTQTSTGFVSVPIDGTITVDGY